jgi:hypothetical protein
VRVLGDRQRKGERDGVRERIEPPRIVVAKLEEVSLGTATARKLADDSTFEQRDE